MGEDESSIPRDTELQCGGGGGNGGHGDGGVCGVKVAATEVWKQMRSDSGGGSDDSWTEDGRGAAGTTTRRRSGVGAACRVGGDGVATTMSREAARERAG
jgi:hypothetical protein